MALVTERWRLYSILQGLSSKILGDKCHHIVDVKKCHEIVDKPLTAR